MCVTIAQNVSYRGETCLQALAIVLASQSDDKKEAYLQLRAQLHYRLGDYGAAIKAYHEVFNQHKARSCPASDTCKFVQTGMTSGMHTSTPIQIVVLQSLIRRTQKLKF